MRSIQKQTPLFLVLLGTAAFSLSTLPEASHKRVTVISISSNAEFASTCDDISDQIGGGANSGTCTVVPVSVDDDSLRYIKSDGKYDLVQTSYRDPKDFNVFKHYKNSLAWEVTTVCDGTDCPGGSANIIKKKGTVSAEN